MTRKLKFIRIIIVSTAETILCSSEFVQFHGHWFLLQPLECYRGDCNATSIEACTSLKVLTDSCKSEGKCGVCLFYYIFFYFRQSYFTSIVLRFPFLMTASEFLTSIPWEWCSQILPKQPDAHGNTIRDLRPRV